MFLRLRYYFKTDRKIRVQDKQEYADQRKKLKKLDNIMEQRREDITTLLYAPPLNNKRGCIEHGKTAEYYCLGFSFNHPCNHGCYCPRQSETSRFFKERQEYFSQKQIVHDFWRNRMRERVKG